MTYKHMPQHIPKGSTRVIDEHRDLSKSQDYNNISYPIRHPYMLIQKSIRLAGRERRVMLFRINKQIKL